jgi:beta-phosphoglucomutase-like phosphatase (HAD superfamily)
MGIGHYLARHTEYRYLYGTVSISSEYTPASRALMLTYLKEHGYLIGMATSTGQGSAMEHLTRTGMLDYFAPDAIITGNMVKNGKPAPDIYLLAAERLGVSPEECVGVEDSLNGVRSIHAAGMRAVMIPDMIEPTPEVEGLCWKRCDTLLDIIPLLTETP